MTRRTVAGVMAAAYLCAWGSWLAHFACTVHAISALTGELVHVHHMQGEASGGATSQGPLLHGSFDADGHEHVDQCQLGPWCRDRLTTWLAIQTTEPIPVAYQPHATVSDVATQRDGQPLYMLAPKHSPPTV
jgi:hypothetical protein